MFRLTGTGIRVVTVLLALAALSFGCTPNSLPPHASQSPVTSVAATAAPDPSSARSLLARHSLDATGLPQAGVLRLDPNSPELQLVSDASAGSGLPLHGVDGASFASLTFPLSQRTDAGSVDAVFLYRGDQVAGAYLELHGYHPPYASLNETFAPLQ